MPSPSKSQHHDVLIVVHPNSALRGPALKLSLQWALISEWRGPVFILDDENSGGRVSPAANTYRAIIDEVIDQTECLGRKCRIEANDEDGLLEDAAREVLARTHSDAHVTVTGAWADGCVAAVASIIQNAEREVSIDASAIWPDDVDEGAEAEMAERLSALMKQVRNTT